MFPTIRPGALRLYSSSRHFAREWLISHYGYIPFPSPLLNPGICEKMIRDFNKELGAPYSGGDYGVDRSEMWNGFYGHAEGKYIHLGADFNVTPGTPVCVDHDCEVVLVDTDHSEQNPEPGGWGRRVMVAIPEFRMYQIYAHLSPLVHCSVNDKLKAGQLIGRVGTSKNNGQWYPHLHVQMLTEEGWNYFHCRVPELDGYCTPQQWALMSQRCPNPAPFVKIP